MSLALESNPYAYSSQKLVSAEDHEAKCLKPLSMVRMIYSVEVQLFKPTMVIITFVVFYLAGKDPEEVHGHFE